MTHIQENSSILVVDDNRINLQVISQALKSLGVNILKADNGSKALEIIEETPPELILLDVMMPGMDGYEVCRRVKQSPIHKDIPVIFLTANVESDNIIFAFEAGIVDYIAKPFNPSELLARVKTHLDLTLSKNKLKDLNEELKRYNVEKNEFLGMVSHDLKNPIYNIQMLAKVINEDKNLSRDELDEFSVDILTSTTKMLNLIHNLLDINKIESGEKNIKLESIDIIDFIEKIINSFEEQALNKNQKIFFNSNAKSSKVYADETALNQTFENLISNAIKYSDREQSIFVNINDDKDTITIEIKDHGQGFTDEEIEKAFNKFVKLDNKPTAGESSTGLGLSIAKRYVQEMNGDIWLESVKGEGSSFFVKLPKS